jgi:DNA-binding MarR family transcriptional regulator
MEIHLTAQQALNLWRIALSRAVHELEPDLSARQMAILLNVYLTPAPHTVRGLAGQLSLAKPAVTRALDRLQTAGFIRRAPDRRDGRSVIIEHTVKGAAFLGEFGAYVSEAGHDVAAAVA